jgi:hypothetical protein
VEVVVALASVHLVDGKLGAGIRLLRKRPQPGVVPGLLQADLALAAPLDAKPFPPPASGRIGMVAFWSSDADLDRFLETDPLGKRFAGGWSTRLEPLRASGTWPGLSPDLDRSRDVVHDGPAAVLTLGRLRMRRAIPFLRVSTKAGAAVTASPGFAWGTAMARPPFVSTCSLWESSDALKEYAYRHVAHVEALAADRRNPFHVRSAFVRFRPYGTTGSLTGENPLAEHLLPVADA